MPGPLEEDLHFLLPVIGMCVGGFAGFETWSSFTNSNRNNNIGPRFLLIAGSMLGGNKVAELVAKCEKVVIITSVGLFATAMVLPSLRKYWYQRENE